MIDQLIQDPQGEQPRVARQPDDADQQPRVQEGAGHVLSHEVRDRGERREQPHGSQLAQLRFHRVEVVLVRRETLVVIRHGFGRCRSDRVRRGRRRHVSSSQHDLDAVHGVTNRFQPTDGFPAAAPSGGASSATTAMRACGASRAGTSGRPWRAPGPPEDSPPRFLVAHRLTRLGLA